MSQHDDFNPLWINKKVYKEIAALPCQCEGAFERCLRCRTLDEFRKADRSARYSEDQAGYLIDNRGRLENLIEKQGSDEIKIEAEEIKADCRSRWEARKEERGWK